MYGGVILHFLNKQDVYITKLKCHFWVKLTKSTSKDRIGQLQQKNYVEMNRLLYQNIASV